VTHAGAVPDDLVLAAAQQWRSVAGGGRQLGSGTRDVRACGDANRRRSIRQAVAHGEVKQIGGVLPRPGRRERFLPRQIIERRASTIAAETRPNRTHVTPAPHCLVKRVPAPANESLGQGGRIKEMFGGIITRTGRGNKSLTRAYATCLGTEISWWM